MALGRWAAKREANELASERQLRANRSNAQKSTGPRTVEGKWASSQNALRHGLTSLRGVLEGEDAALYEALSRQLIDEFRPATVLDTMLVQQLANVVWRLRRSTVYEAALLTWLSHLQSQAHDTHGFVLGQTFVPLDPAGLAMQDGKHYGGEIAAMSARSLLQAGRTLESALGTQDLLSKLSRYEAQLIRQLERILAQIAIPER